MSRRASRPDPVVEPAGPAPLRRGPWYTIAPFALLAVIGEVDTAWSPKPLDDRALVASIVLLGAALAGLGVPLVRRVAWGPTAIVIAYVASVVMIQLAEGGPQEGSGGLLLIPVIAVALLRTPREVVAAIASVLLAIYLVGALSGTPDSLTIRRVVLTGALCTLMAISVLALRSNLGRSLEAARRRMHQAQTLEVAAVELASLRTEAEIVATAVRTAERLAAPSDPSAVEAAYLVAAPARNGGGPDRPSGSPTGTAGVVRAEVRPDGELHGELRLTARTGVLGEECEGELVALAGLVELSLANLFAHRRLEDQVKREERRRIARELHDGLAHELAFISTRARSSERHGGDPAAGELARSADRALDEARRAIAVLSATEDLQLRDGIAQTAEDFGGRYDLPVEVELVGDLEVPAEVREHVLRIVREALANAARHGRPGRVWVRAWRDDALHVVVRDDGTGFDPRAATSGFGLTSMRERAASIGGSVEVRSVPGRGTTVELLVG